jgi:aspartyl aminopeptidase
MSELSYKKKNIFEVSTPEQLQAIDKFAEGYKDFLNHAKTERDAVKTTIALAEKYGYKPYRFGEKLKTGDKKYYNNRNKNIFLFQIGEENIE